MGVVIAPMVAAQSRSSAHFCRSAFRGVGVGELIMWVTCHGYRCVRECSLAVNDLDETSVGF